VFALVNNLPSVVEYSEIGAERGSATTESGRLVYEAGNICYHYYSMEFLKSGWFKTALGYGPGYCFLSITYAVFHFSSAVHLKKLYLANAKMLNFLASFKIFKKMQQATSGRIFSTSRTRKFRASMRPAIRSSRPSRMCEGNLYCL
jgi:hypothetical protein